MRVPIHWLQDYVETSKSAKDIAASFTQLGLMLDKPLDDSGVLDLEHRMDRSDWLSIVGCARDFAAFENLPLNEPKLYGKTGKPVAEKDAIKIVVDTPHVRRFNTVVIKGIKVQESPDWLKERISAYGIDPINNIVDITNFCMVELGQPMHAQDIAKLKGRDITIRQAQKGEHVVTLLGTDIKLDPDTFILTSGGEPTVIGGIVGGKATGVTNTTTDIILDAGNYDQAVIRKTSRRLKIINETVSRYDKFLDPSLCELAIKRAVGLILDIAGGEYYANFDYYPNISKKKSLTLRYSRLAQLSGMDVKKQDIKRILKSLGYVITEESDLSMVLEIPYYRTDVEVEDDLVADILRIGDYRNLPTLPLSSPVPKDITPSIYNFEDKLRDLMVSMGCHEHITSSLVKSEGSVNQIVLANALSADQNALRLSITPSLLKVLSYYAKQGIANATLFEIGKVFEASSGVRQEIRHLTTVGGNVKNTLATLIHTLGINSHTINKQGEVLINQTKVGDIDDNSVTLLTEELQNFYHPYSGVISEFSHSTSLDISLDVPEGILYSDILEAAQGLDTCWSSITCKEVTDLQAGHRNYLISIEWPEKSAQVEVDKKNLLQALSKLEITSKS